MSKIRNDHLLRATQWSDLDLINILTHNFFSLKAWTTICSIATAIGCFVYQRIIRYLCKWLDIRRWLSGNGWGVVWMWTHCGSLALNNNPPLDARRGGGEDLALLAFLALLALFALLLVDQQAFLIQDTVWCSCVLLWSSCWQGHTFCLLSHLQASQTLHCFGFLIKHY